jgi:hypothetical protein
VAQIVEAESLQTGCLDRLVGSAESLSLGTAARAGTFSRGMTAPCSDPLIVGLAASRQGNPRSVAILGGLKT